MVAAWPRCVTGTGSQQTVGHLVYTSPPDRPSVIPPTTLGSWAIPCWMAAVWPRCDASSACLHVPTEPSFTNESLVVVESTTLHLWSSWRPHVLTDPAPQHTRHHDNIRPLLFLSNPSFLPPPSSQCQWPNKKPNVEETQRAPRELGSPL